MNRKWLAAAACMTAAWGAVPAVAAGGSDPATGCSSGAHTLSLTDSVQGVYKNSFGEVHILSPWRLVDYWSWTREPNRDDFVIR